MKCEQAETLLVDYQRDELAATERSALALHLQLCERCSAELASLLAMSRLLDREQQPSPLARERFLARVQQQTAAVPGSDLVRTGFALWFQQLWAARPLAAFSYSAVLLAVGLLSGQLLPPHALGVGPQQAGLQQIVEQKLSQDRIVQLCSVPPATAPVL